MIRFGSPQYFWLLLVIPTAVALFIWSYQRRRAVMERFAAADMLHRLAPDISFSRRVWKRILFCAALFFLVLALVRPRFGVKMEMMERKGVDIFFLLDVSKSMLASDITPNRIERAKHEIAKFIELLHGDRVGLIVFAGESYVQCPLTLDYGAAGLFLDAVSTDWIDLQGTAIAGAIRRAMTGFKTKKKKHKVLVILSDGEDHEGEAIEAAREAAAEGVVIYTMGIGSEQGVPIPLRRGSGNVIYKKDRAGNLVMTRLNPMILEKIALEGNGRYFHAGAGLDLSLIYQEIDRMEKQQLGSNRLTTYKEQYQLPLAVALALIVIEFFIAERAAHTKEWAGRFE